MPDPGPVYFHELITGGKQGMGRRERKGTETKKKDLLFLLLLETPAPVLMPNITTQ